MGPSWEEHSQTIYGYRLWWHPGLWGDGAHNVVPTEVRRVSCINWMSDSVHKHEVPTTNCPLPCFLSLPGVLWPVGGLLAPAYIPTSDLVIIPNIIHFKQPVIARSASRTAKKFGLRRIEKSVQHVAPLKGSGLRHISYGQQLSGK